MGPVCLSKVTNLKFVGFECSSNPKWVTLILRTLTPHNTNLQQITIDAPYIFYARLGQDCSRSRPQGSPWGDGLRRVVGTRPPRLTVGVTFGPIGGTVRYIPNDGQRESENLCGTVVAGDNGAGDG